MLDLFAYDQSILSALTSPALSALKPFFFALTEVGSPTALLIYSAIVIALGNAKLKKIAAVLAIALLLATIVTEDVKDLVQRPRPYAGVAPAYLYTNNYSFPSGHAVGAFVCATIILAYFGWKWGLIGYVMAALIGISRIVLDVHYPSDVLAGAVIGFILGELVMFAAYRLGFYGPGGILSKLIKKKDKMPDVNKKPLFGLNSYLIMIAILLGLILPLYSLNHLSFAITVTALASLLIIYALPTISNEHAPVTSILAVIMIGTISAYSTMIVGGYILSIAITMITYLTILLLSERHAGFFTSGSWKV